MQSKHEQGQPDTFVFKIDERGNIEWQTMILEEGKASAQAKAIVAASDGTYIIAGNMWSDDTYPVKTEGDMSCFAVKLDS